MSLKINSVLATLNSYPVRTEQFEGQEHLVVPVVILTEGVHCGSAGCKLYTAKELSALPQAWNGIPLPVFHPEDPNGIPLSANDPDIIQQQSVGRLFNTLWTRGKLKSELWVDIQKAQEISPETLATIHARKPLEVSTGLYSFDENISGQWNGEAYDSVVRNIVPDHLALLPGGLGACSFQDGCGVRANQRQKGGTGEMEEEPLVIERAFYTAPQSSIQRVHKQLVANLGEKAGARKLHGMTCNEVIALDKKILEATTVNSEATVNNEEEPLTI